MDRSIVHADFTLERIYPVPPDKVFAAFASVEAKGAWWGGTEGWTIDRWDLDFQVNGREINHSRMTDGPEIVFEAFYQDIVPTERIVYSYQMEIDGNRISVSLATLEFEPSEGGTHLTLTEHGAYLDGLDNVEQRREGTEGLLDALGTALTG